ARLHLRPPRCLAGLRLFDLPRRLFQRLGHRLLRVVVELGPRARYHFVVELPGEDVLGIHQRVTAVVANKIDQQTIGLARMNANTTAAPRAEDPPGLRGPRNNDRRYRWIIVTLRQYADVPEHLECPVAMVAQCAAPQVYLRSAVDGARGT